MSQTLANIIILADGCQGWKNESLLFLFLIVVINSLFPDSFQIIPAGII